MKDKIIEILKERSQLHVKTDEPQEVWVISSSDIDDTFKEVATRIEGVMWEWVIKGTKEGLKCRTCGSYFARGLKQDYCPSCNYYSIEKI